ncbi:MAG: CBS domain-containing protein [Candidatus Rokubacteria bacterium]|nr:CBS domain-containing protein [Candidatus Rokubacteria bacterium]MBI2554672.1 CBS domain-containing protein [Candidatus Rokubacteria bacterium]
MRHEPRVRDWMHEGAITCAPGTPLPEVAQTMRAHAISALVVVDAAGLAVGVISRTDLANASFVEPYMRHWRGMTASHLMTSPVISVRAEMPVAEALDLLKAKKIHRLVVTEPAPGGGERPIGILSLTDVVRHLEPT